MWGLRRSRWRKYDWSGYWCFSEGSQYAINAKASECPQWSWDYWHMKRKSIQQLLKSEFAAAFVLAKSSPRFSHEVRSWKREILFLQDWWYGRKCTWCTASEIVLSRHHQAKIHPYRGPPKRFSPSASSCQAEQSAALTWAEPDSSWAGLSTDRVGLSILKNQNCTFDCG